MTATVSDTMDQALARAVVYRTLSLGFQFPSAARLRELGAGEAFGAARLALEFLSERTPHGRLQDVAARLGTASVEDLDGLAASYWRLFGHTTRGLICACETEYGPDNGFHQPQLLADINGYYLAFGLRPAALSEARADHIACECEFMDFLNRKEALLTSEPQADAETLAVTREAARTFLRDHLGRFGRAFAGRVATEDRGGYFGAFGELLAAWVEAECARTGVAPGPLDLALRPECIDDSPVACGSSDELIQIQRRR